MHPIIPALAAALLAAAPAWADTSRTEQPAKPGEDTSGRIQRGEASYYHPNLHGRPMANGEPFDSRSNSAASRTLPLGTIALVRNLETGQMATVEIEDRGPYAGGRVLDVSPKTAEALGMKQDGTAPVEIAPVQVPQPDGTLKPGAGANR
jgi:rare lipoprotein A